MSREEGIHWGRIVRCGVIGGIVAVLIVLAISFCGLIVFGSAIT